MTEMNSLTAASPSLRPQRLVQLITCLEFA
jgi:hypothetical protein